MDTQNSSMIDVPNLKLAKVGQDRDRKKGGGGWLGANGAGSGVAGSGIGASGFMGSGMSLAKLLTVLLMSGCITAGAWKLGDKMAANSAKGAKPVAKKVFADKDSSKYADTSGVIKGKNTIPNSLGYINNDGLTDEQRAANKAAQDAAAAKAAADAQAQADADAKAKALSDQQAASATPAPAAPVAAAPVAKPSLAGGKLGGLGSVSGSGGGSGGGLNGGSGLSGGIGSKFGSAGGPGSGGSLGGFQNGSAASTKKASAAPRAHFGGANQALGQLGNANTAGRGALGSAQGESASATGGSPFDNGQALGTVISGPGVGSGAPGGSPDAGGSANAGGGGGGGGGGDGGPLESCADVNEVLDANGGCTIPTTNTGPTAADAAPYQGLLDAILICMAAVLVINMLALAFSKTLYGKTATAILMGLMCALGVAIMTMGAIIAGMNHGSILIGGICTLVGGFITVQAAMTLGGANSLSNGTPMTMANQAAPTLIATAVGALVAGVKDATMNGAAMM